MISRPWLVLLGIRIFKNEGTGTKENITSHHLLSLVVAHGNLVRKIVIMSLPMCP